jgi:8-oxo-dGTP diphosphatase
MASPVIPARMAINLFIVILETLLIKYAYVFLREKPHFRCKAVRSFYNNPINIMARVLSQTFGVAGAILERDGKILLVKENGPGQPDHGKWSHPAGWIEVGENPIETAKKEAREEAGIIFEPEHLLGVYSIWRKDIKILSEGKRLHGDTLEARWFTPEEIQDMGKSQLRDSDIKQMVRDYFSGKRYPVAMVHHAESR